MRQFPQAKGQPVWCRDNVLAANCTSKRVETTRTQLAGSDILFRIVSVDTSVEAPGYVARSVRTSFATDENAHWAHVW